MECLIFAPGIMGTGLRNNQGSVWPPKATEMIFGYKRINDLISPHLTPTEPIRKVGPMGVYRTLLDDISACGFSAGNKQKQYVAFPYDWRLPNATNAQNLADLLDTTFPQIEDDQKITFLGHSMGGLVMRYLLESGEFTDKPWFSKINRLITLGTPHHGASLALFRLRGTDKFVGLSGPDLKLLANQSGYSSGYELVPPDETALTTNQPQPGDLPSAMDPFDAQIVTRLGMDSQNINLAQYFWSKIALDKKPLHTEYLFVVGSSLKTNVRNEWINSNKDPMPVIRKSAGDGTVPIASACVAWIPHIFSKKKHMSIFTDRTVRRYLYHYLNAPAHVQPQAAGDVGDVGGADAIGISVNQEVYDPGEEIEVVISYNQDMTDPQENFALISIDPETGVVDASTESKHINIRLRGVTVSEFGFSIAEDLAPGFYELSSNREVDDPEPTTFYVRKVPDDD